MSTDQKITNDKENGDNEKAEGSGSSQLGDGYPSAASVTVVNGCVGIAQFAVKSNNGQTEWTGNVDPGDSVTIVIAERQASPPIQSGDSCWMLAAIVAGSTNFQSANNFQYDPKTGSGFVAYKLGGWVADPSWDGPHWFPHT